MVNGMSRRRALIFAAVALVALVGLMAAIGVWLRLAGLLRTASQMGAYGSIVQAVASVFAVVAASVAGIAAYDLFKIESKRDRLAEEERKQAAADRQAAALEARRAQASKITTWWALHQTESHVRIVKTPSGGTFVGPWVWGSYVRNTSELPVYDVRTLFYLVNDQPDGTWTVSDQGSTPEPIRVLPGEDIVLVAVPREVSNMAPQKINANTFVTGVEFRDAAGVRWSRNAYGELEELS